MSLQGWSETLVFLQADGPTLNTSTTATSLIGAATNVSTAAKFSPTATLTATRDVVMAYRHRD